MKIGIYGQFYHSESEMYIQLILDSLQHKDVEVVIEENHGVEDLCVLLMEEIDQRCRVIRRSQDWAGCGDEGADHMGRLGRARA